MKRHHPQSSFFDAYNELTNGTLHPGNVSNKNKKNKKKSIPSTTGAIIPIGILYHNSIAATLTAPLNLKLLHFLKDVLIHLNHLLF